MFQTQLVWFVTSSLPTAAVISLQMFILILFNPYFFLSAKQHSFTFLYLFAIVSQTPTSLIFQ